VVAITAAAAAAGNKNNSSSSRGCTRSRCRLHTRHRLTHLLTKQELTNTLVLTDKEREVRTREAS